jgi:hypothetical protein
MQPPQKGANVGESDYLRPEYHAPVSVASYARSRSTLFSNTLCVCARVSLPLCPAVCVSGDSSFCAGLPAHARSSMHAGCRCMQAVCSRRCMQAVCRLKARRCMQAVCRLKVHTRQSSLASPHHTHTHRHAHTHTHTHTHTPVVAKAKEARVRGVKHMALGDQVTDTEPTHTRRVGPADPRIIRDPAPDEAIARGRERCIVAAAQCHAPTASV